MDKLLNGLNGFFKVNQKGSTVKTEILAGFTTFVTMAYILVFNADILSGAGLDGGAVFVATALASAIGTVLIGLVANLPFALAPGMGLNTFFTYTIVLGMGFSPEFALAAIFAEGLAFIILSLTKFGEKLFDAVPMTLKNAMGCGIGLFIMFIGMKNAGIVVGEGGAVLVGLGKIARPETALALIGTMLTCALLVRKVKGALLIGIAVTWGLGIIAQLAGWYTVDLGAVVPDSLIMPPPSIMPTLGVCFTGFGEVLKNPSSLLDFLVISFSFLFVDIFNTVGTLSGVASKAGMLDESGRLENSGKAFFAGAVATAAGAVLGTSNITAYVESAAGVVEGGRTGLTSVTAAVLFLLSLFLWPVFSTVPPFATATALIAVGILMVEPIRHLNLESLEELIPLVITMVSMPFFGSVSDGLFFGVISYITVKAALREFSQISPVLWASAAVFIVKVIFF